MKIENSATSEARSVMCFLKL